MSTLPETSVSLDTVDILNQIILCCAGLSCAFCPQPSTVSRRAQNRPSLRATAQVTETTLESFFFLPFHAEIASLLAPDIRRQVGISHQWHVPMLLPISELLLHNRVSVATSTLSLVPGELVTAGHRHPYDQLSPVERARLTWSSILSLPG